MVNVEKEFLKLITDLTDKVIYVKTENHSSGFNEVKLDELFKADKDFLSREKRLYLVNEENEAEDYLTFIEVMKKYPEFTLDKRLAFCGNFETWERLEKSLKEEMRINLLDM